MVSSCSNVAHLLGLSDLRFEPQVISLGESSSVSGVLVRPDNAFACYVFAHGAGADMNHPFMENMAARLAVRGVATLRYQFPYAERRSRRVDSAQVATQTVRAAVRHASKVAVEMPVFAGGKSFGGRMTSQAQADAPLAGVKGLAFIGFPLHAAGKPQTLRADHLARVAVPMLFLQGTRDALADSALVTQTVAALQPRATLHRVEQADHGFHVLVRSGRTDDQIKDELAAALSGWMTAVLGG